MKKFKEKINFIRELLSLVSPLKFQMSLAVLFGSIGHILATFIPALGALFVGFIMTGKNFEIKTLIIILVLFSIFRSVLKYLEQLLNHYVAFRTLAIIRDRVFKSLRRLAPQKMDTKEKGELISIITSDIELLEVFYAHTISPVLIFIIHTTTLFIIVLRLDIVYGLILFLFHIILGVVVPIFTRNKNREGGMEERYEVGRLNGFILESFKGIKELINFSYGESRLHELNNLTDELNKKKKKLSKEAGKNIAISNAVVIFGTLIFMIAISLRKNTVNPLNSLVAITIFISSFGPSSALSSLANNLITTFACGKRVLDLLKEEPLTREIENGVDFNYKDLEVEEIGFSYGENKLFENFSMGAKTGEIIGISGNSGSGKSTFIKILMRFFDVEKGSVRYNKTEVKNINTKSLRENISYTEQKTHLFKGTIRDNLKIAKQDATDLEIIEALKKASIYDFVKSLPEGIDTNIVDDKEMISEGQKQRLQLARMFLRDSKLFLLDEPTANIDALNEAVILKSLYEERNNRTIIMSSHRISTLKIADKILEIKRNINS